MPKHLCLELECVRVNSLACTYRLFNPLVNDDTVVRCPVGIQFIKDLDG